MMIATASGNGFWHRRGHAVGLAVILILGFALRVPYLNSYIPNPDEGWQLLAALQPDWVSAMRYNYDDITHPPFVILLMHALLKLIDADWFIRLVGALAGAGISFAGYHLGKAVMQGSRAFGLLTAIGLTFSLDALYIPVMIRSYVYLLLFMVAGLVFYLRFARKARLRDAALYSLFMALAIFSEYAAALVVFACGITLAADFCDRFGPRDRRLLFWCAAHALLAAWFAWGYLQHPFTSGESHWNTDFYYADHRLGYVLKALLLLPVWDFGWVGYVFLFFFLVSAAALYREAFFRTTIAIPYVILIAVAVVLDSYEFYPVRINERYTIYLEPLCWILFCAGFFVAWKKHVAINPIFAPIVVLPILVFQTLAMGKPSHEFMFPKSELGTLEAAIRALPKGSVILMGNQERYMLYRSGMLTDEIKKDGYVRWRVGNKVLLAPDHPALVQTWKDGRTTGMWHITPEMMTDFLARYPNRKKKFYLLEMGFGHYFSQDFCADESARYLREIYRPSRVVLWAYSREDGLRLAEECIRRRAQQGLS